MLSKRYSVLLGLLYQFQGVLLFKAYQNLIPNGDAVPDPCSNGKTWEAVGHMTSQGGTDRNPFGLDFVTLGKVWSEELCNTDSDGDGKSNGVELGDPDCLWSRGDNSVGMGTAVSHPGICEPTTSNFCKSKNSWLDCKPEEFQCAAIQEQGVKDFTIQFPRTKVPADSTTYTCMIVDSPMDQDYHIVATTPNILSPGIVHHLLLYGCVEDGPYGTVEQKTNEPFSCGMGATMQCMTDLLSVWVVGSQGECMHRNAGFRIGPTGYRKLALQMHWTNPENSDNLQDSSGMTLYITPNLRPYDAGILWTGQSYIEIPPRQDSYKINGSCSEECTRAMFKEDITLIGALPHMHLIGTAQTVTQYRNGQLQRTLLNTTSYEYNRPLPLNFTSPIIVRAGDELRTTCTYNSKNRRHVTIGGDSTSDEMCIAFIQFYPKSKTNAPMPLCMNYKELSLCKSAPEYEESFPDRLDGCDVVKFGNLGNPIVFDIMFQVQSKCKPNVCLQECKNVVRKFRKNPCLKGDVWEYLKFQLLNIKTKTFISGKIEPLMAAYTSCDLELGIEKGVIQGENNMMKYMAANHEEIIDCKKCQANTLLSTTNHKNVKCESPKNSAVLKTSYLFYVGTFITVLFSIVA